MMMGRLLLFTSCRQIRRVSQQKWRLATTSGACKSPPLVAARDFAEPVIFPDIPHGVTAFSPMPAIIRRRGGAGAA